MSAILRPLIALIFAVSLLCGGAAMAHGVSMDAPHAPHAMADHHGQGGHDCDDCDGPGDMAGMACAAMAAHCAPALASMDGAGQVIGRIALPMVRIAPVDLILIGVGPESDTPPPRA